MECLSSLLSRWLHVPTAESVECEHEHSTTISCYTAKHELYHHEMLHRQASCKQEAVWSSTDISCHCIELLVVVGIIVFKPSQSSSAINNGSSSIVKLSSQSAQVLDENAHKTRTQLLKTIQNFSHRLRLWWKLPMKLYPGYAP